MKGKEKNARIVKIKFLGGISICGWGKQIGRSGESLGFRVDVSSRLTKLTDGEVDKVPAGPQLPTMLQAEFLETDGLDHDIFFLSYLLL